MIVVDCWAHDRIVNFFWQQVGNQLVRRAAGVPACLERICRFSRSGV